MVGEIVDTEVGPHDEVGEEGTFHQKESAPPLELAVVEELEKVDDDVRNVVQIEHYHADAHIVGRVGDGQQRDRREMVCVHEHVVLVSLFDETVQQTSAQRRGRSESNRARARARESQKGHARVDPNAHLQKVDQVDRALCHLAIFWMRQPEVPVVLDPVLRGAILDVHHVVFDRCHTGVDDELPHLILELVECARLAERIAGKQVAREGAAHERRAALDQADHAEESGAVGGQREHRRGAVQRHRRRQLADAKAATNTSDLGEQDDRADEVGQRADFDRLGAGLRHFAERTRRAGGKRLRRARLDLGPA
eukprot:6042094-Prymnesium_polylepis.1